MQPVSILVVEDESIVAEDLRERLTKMGTTVLGPVATGEQAVEVAEQSHPDLVLMDIRLKGRMDGVEAADQIRKKCHIPVVYLTAHSDDHTLERAKRSQPEGYLLKPFEESDLRVNIELALSKHAIEEQLRQSEQRYLTTLSSIGDAVIAIDNRSRITFMNPVAEQLTQWRCQEAAGRPLDQVFRILNEATRTPAANPVARAMREGHPADLDNGTLLVSKNGREIPIDDCAAPIFDQERRLQGGVLVFRDVTEKRNAAEAHRKAQEHIHWLERLDAIGRFAGGMAHEINNMLTVVLGCGELLLTHLSQEHALRPTLDAMLAVGDRTAALTRELLAFSRKQHLSPTHVDLNQVLQRLEMMFTRLLGAHIEVALQLEPKLAPVFVDRLQWEQLLVNLALNARDAMPQGGVLTLITRNVAIDDGFAAVHPEVTPGPHVLLAVRDNGSGMDEATVAHIFEPFFTTKEIGKGTGLGLATVYGTVAQSGGHVFVDSAPGKGTIFSMYLPVAAQAVASKPPPSGPALAIPTGSETVLLAEDEEAVRTWMALALRDMGYTVLTATRADEALKLANDYSEPIHLLVTDVIMPKVMGPQLARSFSELRPETRVLYMSGYADDQTFPAELRETSAFLQKPFTVSTLAWAVRNVLDE
ncbi:MAG: response regulator [Gemmataceae bacterium]|nr:response regulator [Gemmataceae bacterium]